MKKWDVSFDNDFVEATPEKVVDLLLKNRGLRTKKEVDAFLHPNIESVTVESVGVDKEGLQKTLKRIEGAIKKKQRIIIYGDYDVDGICGTAILWETLYMLQANVMPYIPHRVDEGYGLSVKGIGHVLEKYPDTKLIITVDNGIVAHAPTEFAKEKGIDVIITDHHVKAETMPDALAIVHTTKLCGTGVAYLLSQEIKKQHPERPIADTHEHLELVALATIADLVPLLDANRTLTKYGLEQLRSTKRVGLIELFKEAVLNPKEIKAYHVGHVISPRLNAMGRLEYAMESLRLLCTKDVVRAQDLALRLGSTNRERQQLTVETVQHAKGWVTENKLTTAKLLFVAHESYQPGVIGLVAGRLVEEFYRPSIVLSVGGEYAKASARSIRGFNIIEFIRSASEHLVDAGGHPMAAGFTVETKKIEILRKALTKKAEELLTEDAFIRKITIDCELPFAAITTELCHAIAALSPFGMGNPEPIFMTKNVLVKNRRLIGKDQKHVKLFLEKDGKIFDAIAFGMAETFANVKEGEAIDIAYTLDENTWNGTTKLQLKLKDVLIP